MNFHISSRVAVIAITALLLLGTIARSAADIAGTTMVGTIDLSPGPDVYGPRQLALNPATRRLYVAGNASDSRVNGAIKVINAATEQVVSGIDLGRYAGDSNGFSVLDMTLDDSSAPQGNKLYVLGRAHMRQNAFLRVIDAGSDTSVTGEGTDVLLPINAFALGAESPRAVVNPANHKVYIAQGSTIVVVDGPNRQILKTLSSDTGTFLVASRATNKVFVLGKNGGAIIDSSSDTIAALPAPLTFTANAAAVDEARRRIYVAGVTADFTRRIFVLDAASGELLFSKQVTTVGSIAFVAANDTVYAGSSVEVTAHQADDLSPKGSFAIAASTLAGDSEGLFLLGGGGQKRELTDAVGRLDLNLTKLEVLRVGYRPDRVVINRRTNRVYVTDRGAGRLLMVDGSSHEVLASINLPPTDETVPREIALSERLNRIYVTRFAPGSGPVLDVVDGVTHELRKSIQVGGTSGVAVDDTRRRLYVGGSRWVGRGQNQLFLDVFDADTETFLTSVDLGADIVGGSPAVAVNPVTGRIYAAFGGIRIIDGNTLLPVARVDGIPPIRINERANKIYVRGGRGSVRVIDGRTDSLERTFFSDTTDEVYAKAVAIDEEMDRVYISDLFVRDFAVFGRVAGFDAANNYQLLGRLERAPEYSNIDFKDVAFNPVTRQVLSPDSLLGTILVLQAEGTAAKDQFGNLSTRVRVGGADDVMISGFIVEGAPGSTKKVIVRAVGPSMQALGVAGALSDTTLELHTAAGDVITNDNWKVDAVTGASRQAEIEATGLAPSNDLEAAIIADLPAGAHTAVIRGKGAVGVGLAEVFVLDANSPAQLANIATRGRVETGENVMIGGFIVRGSTPSRALVRAIGPSLQDRLSGVLEDPVLELYDINGGLIAANDDWKSTHEAEIAATTITPTNERESAIVATFSPGNYTAIVRGKDETSGVAIVEAYRLP
jgi:DNA-binding beta-propeller fold protein YncE